MHGAMNSDRNNELNELEMNDQNFVLSQRDMQN